MCYLEWVIMDMIMAHTALGQGIRRIYSAQMLLMYIYRYEDVGQATLISGILGRLISGCSVGATWCVR